jgi:hypothetical protein
MDEKVPWKNDRECTICEHCEVNFGILRRKHHCRRCGGIYCNECCGEKVKGILGYGETLQRVCISCRDTLAAIKETGSSRPRERRMVVVGAHQTGKTEICCAVDKALGDPSSPNHTKPVKYRGSEYTVHVVDVEGGPELFRPSYTIGVHAFVIVFNVGDRSSFVSAQQLVERVALFGPSRLIMLTGHKCEGTVRAVSTEEGKLWSAKHGCVYRELSSRSHHEVVDFVNDIVARIADSEV